MEIQANKKLISKTVVLLQPFDTQLLFSSPDLLMEFGSSVCRVLACTLIYMFFSVLHLQVN